MLQKLNKKNKGFTLVEIMIVVAIIALLSAIAVPNFLRARQRSQATRVLEDLRLVEAAKDQWALENNKKGADTVTADNLKSFFKTGSHIIETDGQLTDSIGNAITLSTVQDPVLVSEATKTEFAELLADQTDFWGVFDPANAGGGGGEGEGGGEGGGE